MSKFVDSLKNTARAFGHGLPYLIPSVVFGQGLVEKSLTVDPAALGLMGISLASLLAYNYGLQLKRLQEYDSCPNMWGTFFYNNFRGRPRLALGASLVFTNATDTTAIAAALYSFFTKGDPSVVLSYILLKKNAEEVFTLLLNSPQYMKTSIYAQNSALDAIKTTAGNIYQRVAHL